MDLAKDFEDLGSKAREHEKSLRQYAKKRWWLGFHTSV